MEMKQRSMEKKLNRFIGSREIGSYMDPKVSDLLTRYKTIDKVRKLRKTVRDFDSQGISTMSRGIPRPLKFDGAF